MEKLNNAGADPIQALKETTQESETDSSVLAAEVEALKAEPALSAKSLLKM